jgi:hypothetical protein
LGCNLCYTEYTQRPFQLLNSATIISKSVTDPKPKQPIFIIQHSTSQAGEQQLFQHSTTSECRYGQPDNKFREWFEHEQYVSIEGADAGSTTASTTAKSVEWQR